MKRNFNVQLKDSDGRPLPRQVNKYDEKTGMPVLNEKGQHAFSHFEPTSLRHVALDALAGRWRGEEGMSNDELWKRMKLHDRIAFGGDQVDVSNDDVTSLLEAMNHQGCSAFLIARMKDMLESDPPPAVSAQT